MMEEPSVPVWPGWRIWLVAHLQILQERKSANCEGVGPLGQSFCRVYGAIFLQF
jgi:hypothetical protein